MSFLRSSSVRKPSSSKRPTSPVRMKRLPVGLEPLGLARLRRLAVVAESSSTAERPTTSPVSPRRDLAALVVDQADVVALGTAGRRCAACPDAGAPRRTQAAAAFGHAVELDQPARPAREHVGLERRGEGRAGAELHAEATTGRSCRTRAAAMMRWYCTGTSIVWRDAMPLGQRAGTRAASNFGHQHHGAAPGQRRQEAHQRGVRVQRRGEQRDRVGAVAVGVPPRRTCAQRIACGCTMPLGVPVVPEE